MIKKVLLFIIIAIILVLLIDTVVNLTKKENRSLVKIDKVEYDSVESEDDENETDSYVLEKKTEEDGFVWYYFKVKGKIKGVSELRGAMNKDKEIIIQPFWGYLYYNPEEKRFHTTKHIYEGNVEEGTIAKVFHVGVYEQDGTCVIPESKGYAFAIYHIIGTSPQRFYYETGYVNDRTGVNGVCDQFGNVVIEPGGPTVKYEKVKELGKQMFVQYDNDTKIYTNKYIGEDGVVKTYDDATGISNNEDIYYQEQNNNIYSDNTNSEKQRTPVRQPCRACQRNPGICSVCKGTREAPASVNFSKGETIMGKCRNCNGTGICSACGGDGWIEEGVEF